MNKFHLSLVSGWHSHVHKQNDELSVCLYYRDHIIFDDPGYTDGKPWDEILEFKSEKWHSNFWVEGILWAAVTEEPKGSKIDCPCENPITVQAKASRQLGLELARSITLNDLEVVIDDRVLGDIGEGVS
ncbi:MAG: hypothetical protein MZV65_05130 [Chromatiales bacterium]|nr:hypothetical protein [Chromatiales bacterium]